MARRSWSELTARADRARFSIGDQGLYQAPGGALVCVRVIRFRDGELRPDDRDRSGYALDPVIRLKLQTCEVPDPKVGATINVCGTSYRIEGFDPVLSDGERTCIVRPLGR